MERNKSGKSKEVPQVPRGMRDFTPQDMCNRTFIIEKIKSVFLRYGYEPIETPALEYWETLSGKYGEEGERLIYRLTDRGGRELGLRYDLTVPLARFVTNHPEIPRPFKRYQIQPVWRADKPQKGRYREFYQCDFDIVGVFDLSADAEIVAVLYDCLVAIGFNKFKIRLNSRKLIRALVEQLGLPLDSELPLARAIDKFERDGFDGVIAELKNQNLTDEKVSILKRFLSLQGMDFDEVFKSAKTVLENAPSASEGISELKQLTKYLVRYDINFERIFLDLSLARGLDYYTGPIFEATVEGAGIGSVSGGGRYDGLLGIFSGQKIPATGASIGLDRIVTALESLYPETGQKSFIDVLVTRFSDETEDYSYKIASLLRKGGFSVDLYLGDISKKGLRGQLGYAQEKAIPFVIIAGPEEMAQEQVKLKIMKSGEQTNISVDSLPSRLKEIMG